jgi:hypothetical protein
MQLLVIVFTFLFVVINSVWDCLFYILFLFFNQAFVFILNN